MARTRRMAMLLLLSAAPMLLFSRTPAEALATGNTRPASPSPAAVSTSSEMIYPESAPAVPTSDTAEEIQARARIVQDRRDAMAAEVNARAGAGQPAPAGTDVSARETLVPTGESEVASVNRNQANTISPGVSSTLAEPSAAADGKSGVMGGNTYLTRTTNDGATWVSEAIPVGPADAPAVCCDIDNVYSATSDTIFTGLLYTNAALTNGVVRILVRHQDTTPNNSNGVDPVVDCSYIIDPGGAANNVLPDYPHLAVSNGFLFLSLNNLTNGTTWTSAQMRRFNLAQMSACTGTSSNTFDYVGTVGQRITVPAEGATGTMYFGSMDNASTFRLFSWPDSTTTVTQTTTALATASNFSNPDCRGGTGNFDFIERSTAWSIAGFRMRGATGGGRVTFLWPSAPTGGATQSHLRGITLNTATLAIIDQPVVFNNSTCFGYPALASNSSGDIGLSLGFGGQAGGGGTAAQGAVAVDDASSAGVFFPTLLLTAVGTHNRTDARFGDYFTVRAGRCANTWVATNYALNGGTTSGDVNARYIGFQSNLIGACTSPK
jgi:hypothetical protein